MGIYAIKPRFRASLRGAERTLLRLDVSADTVTLAGLGCALAAAGCLLGGALTPAHELVLAVPALVLTRLACNALDGMVAADTGTARPVGLLLNEMCDRLADVALLAAAAVAAGTPWLGLAAIGLVGLASAAGVTAQAAGGRRQYGGIVGKADRMLLLAITAPAAMATGVGPALTTWLAACSVGAAFTLVQRSSAARRDLTTLATGDPR